MIFVAISAIKYSVIAFYLCIYAERYYRLSACITALVVLAVDVLLHRQLDQTVKQRWSIDTHRLPELRIHADICKARQCVDLIKYNPAFLCIEEIHSG